MIRTPVRAPNAKAKAESGVLVVERWILAVLRANSLIGLPPRSVNDSCHSAEPRRHVGEIVPARELTSRKKAVCPKADPDPEVVVGLG